MPLANWHDWAALGMILYSTGLTAPIVSVYTSVHTTQSPPPFKQKELKFLLFERQMEETVTVGTENL